MTVVRSIFFIIGAVLFVGGTYTLLGFPGAAVAGGLAIIALAIEPHGILF